MIKREEAIEALKSYSGYLNFSNVIGAMPLEIDAYLCEKMPRIMNDYRQYVIICNVLDKEPLAIESYLFKIGNGGF